ncbi:MAG: hypothetical protein VKL39_15550 [Leptolyngbyaceae bacterium]|nr:hypothetical protein [Leptolyngbyaceae bacterium]
MGTEMGQKIDAAAITDQDIASVLGVSLSDQKEINQNVPAAKIPKKYSNITTIALDDRNRIDAFII